MSGPEGEPHTSAEVIRAIIDGRGWVTYVLRRSALAMFLDGAEVRTVAETPDDYLRELCVEKLGQPILLRLLEPPNLA